jgi:hypothetical protein
MCTPVQIQKVQKNYNWNTKGVQIEKIIIFFYKFLKKYHKKKKVKKIGPSPGCADSRTVRRFAIGHIFTVNAKTLYI